MHTSMMRPPCQPCSTIIAATLLVTAVLMSLLATVLCDAVPLAYKVPLAIVV